MKKFSDFCSVHKRGISCCINLFETKLYISSTKGRGWTFGIIHCRTFQQKDVYIAVIIHTMLLLCNKPESHKYSQRLLHFSHILSHIIFSLPGIPHSLFHFPSSFSPFHSLTCLLSVPVLVIIYLLYMFSPMRIESSLNYSLVFHFMQLTIL